MVSINCLSEAFKEFNFVCITVNRALVRDDVNEDVEFRNCTVQSHSVKTQSPELNNTRCRDSCEASTSSKFQTTVTIPREITASSQTVQG